jgi:uncharacterized protein (TIGR02646 family)
MFAQKMLDAIQDTYDIKQKKRRLAIKKMALKHYRLSKKTPNTPKLWNDLYEDGIMGKHIHKAVSNFLTKLNGRCCYCQEKIFSNANSNIDHVLPRKHYPQFTFTPHNLAAACITCNALKTGDDFYNENPANMNYCKLSNSWKCFHPNFHDFNDHVQMLCLQSNYIYIRTYIGKTPEGTALCSKHLIKLTSYEAKVPANPQVAGAVTSLQNYISSNGLQPGPALTKLLQSFIDNI